MSPTDRRQVEGRSPPRKTKEAQMSTLSRRILIVEDEPHVRLVFRSALESEQLTGGDRRGWRDRPAQAWSKSRSTSSCSISRCPGIGGMEVLQRLRDAGNNVPVVIVTAFRPRTERRRRR